MRRRRQAGFSYIEVLVGIIVLGIVAAGIAEGLAQSSLLIGKSKADTIAHNIAAAELDQAHRMAYDDLGVVGGNPPGLIPASRTATQSGQTFTIATNVAYVDDQALGQPKNYVNYKKVSVTVTPATGTTAPVTQSTLVAPPSIGAIAGKATAVVTVIDSSTAEPLAGVQVTVDQSTSPARTATTDANGQVVFAGLEPSAIPPTDPRYQYRLTAARTGYVTHASTSPDVMQQHLAAKQTWNATIKMFKPATVTVRLRDKATGAWVTEAATATLETAAPVRVESIFGTTGQFSFTQIAGVPIEPGQYTVKVQPDCYTPVTLPAAAMPAGYPSTTTHVVDVDLDGLPHGYLDVRIVDDVNGSVIPGARVQVLGGDKGIQPVIRAVDANGWVHYCLEPTNSIKYVVAGAASGYATASVLVQVAANATTSMEVRLRRVVNSCGIRLDARTPNKLVRLRGTGSTVYDQYQPTSSAPGAGFGTAFFPSLLPGTYLAYVENGFVAGDINWSPSAGKAVSCIAGNPDRAYRVP
ncbi:MAG: prepilin-type N-terminal cleavage/methylation domain-containing protein [Actinomycetota bacterium]